MSLMHRLVHRVAWREAGVIVERPTGVERPERCAKTRVGAEAPRMRILGGGDRLLDQGEPLLTIERHDPFDLDRIPPRRE